MEDPEGFKNGLYEPLGRRSPDEVPQAVVEDEMAAFNAFAASVRR